MTTNHAPRNAAHPFAIVSSELLRNPDLSSIECRVMGILLNLPQGWQPNVKHLSTLMREGTSAIQRAIARLKQLGYLVCHSIRDMAGRFLRTDWEINEIPVAPTSHNIDVRGNVIAIDCDKKASKNLRREAKHRVKSGQKSASNPQAETLTGTAFDPYIENPYTDHPNMDFDERSNIDIPNIQKSIEREGGATVLENAEEDQEGNQNTVTYQFDQKTDSTQEPTTLQLERCSAPSSSVERQKFYEALLAYCYQRVDIDKPEGYATWVMKESKSKSPEASVAMLWDEFKSGEELGSRMVPPGFRLRGVPEQVVVEAISQDCVSKVGTTVTEAAKSAAGQLRHLPVVAAVANAVKLQLERCLEGATRQVELGIPKEQALLNNLPTYATACTEVSTPQITETKMTEAIDSTDPYALTEENRAARAKACEAIKAVKAVNAKLPKRLSKREQILAANMAAAAEFVALLPAKTEPVVKPVVIEEPVEDEPILW